MDSESLLEKNYRCFLRWGNCIADVGAHAGRHTKIFREICGRFGYISAFEPLPEYADKLRSMFAEFRNVKVFAAAVSDHSGQASFTIQVHAEQESGLRRRIGPKAIRCDEIKVDLTTLDQALNNWRRLDYIKIDTEGGELDVLSGAEAIIAHHRPIISFEAGNDAYEHYGKTTQDFLDYAYLHDMTIFDLHAREMTPALWRAERANQSMCDFFYVPREKKKWFLRKIAD